jgi:hypothetical protein
MNWLRILMLLTTVAFTLSACAQSSVSPKVERDRYGGPYVGIGGGIGF